MARVLLDTTVLIDALRGRFAVERIRACRDDGDSLFVCAVNVEEVWRGAHPSEHARTRRFLRRLRLAPLTRQVAEQAGGWRRHYHKGATTLSQADCLIAAATVGVGATLATGNPRHFPMDGVALEHWPVGA